jgi:phosphoribosylformimino-5-aminoimidazole carboxamide ribotide isomerase
MVSFELIPAIDLKGGRCVQLRQGKKEDEIFSSAENPVEIATGWVIQGVRRLHVIDLDGAFQEKKNNFEVIKKIANSEGVREKVKIQAGGGIRSYETAVELLETGIDRVIFGTVALKSPHLIEQVANAFSPERVMVALDARKGKVAIDGWREVTGVDATEAAKQVERIGAGSLLFTNIDVEGLMEGVDQEIIAEFVSSVSIPVVIAGGVSSEDDIGKIKDAGASGVVMGSALYKGKIDLKELLRRRQDSNL